MGDKVILSFGSNTPDGNDNFDRAIEELSAHEGIQMAQSTRRVLTEPVASQGITSDSPKFLNCLVKLSTSVGYDELNQILKEVELKLGSCKADKRHGLVRMDIDILSYGNGRYHLDDWNRKYVQSLIKEL